MSQQRNQNGFAANYIDVATRIAEFREKHPNGSLQPVDPAQPYRIETIGEQTFIVYTAAAYRTPDDPRPGIGVAWEPFPGRTPYTRGSELMNAETSAWGRAIVAALIADTRHGVASLEEVRNRQAERAQASVPASRASEGGQRVRRSRGRTEEDAPWETPAPANEPVVEDAEIVPDETPAPEAQPTDQPATQAQLTKIFATLREIGWTDKDDCRRAVSAIVGRPIESSRELTRREASELIDTLTLVLQDPDPQGRLAQLVEGIATAEAGEAA